MNKKKNGIIIVLIIGIILIVIAVWMYYQQEISDRKSKQTASNTTELYITTEVEEITTREVANAAENRSSTGKLRQEVTTAEKKQNKKLPDNYEWDEKLWGEPPQIVYDFAENQEKFEYIVKKIDSIVSKEDGFVADLNGGTIYYNDSEEKIKDKKDGNYKKFIEDVKYLLKNTDFYNIVREESGNWCMYYHQEEDWEKYIYYMTYIPDMTEEKAWDEGYIKVVGKWYFTTLWKV